MKMASRRRRMKDIERFFTKVQKTDKCWLWKAYIMNTGYGQFYANGNLCLAHRFSYEWHVGPIPDGFQIDHLCRNPQCVNPSHLEPVTPAENTRRGNAGLHWRIKTHCPRNHPYDKTNTYITPSSGGRSCRKCAQMLSPGRMKKYYAKLARMKEEQYAVTV